ncbi:MAG: phytanoyl-CoA dioxygenase family protein, partial [Acidimicrobiaceae bacterium]|nr:phytanoyl-CoA dioxygenase family protein [Acidimicrobiaceae bacterium]
MVEVARLPAGCTTDDIVEANERDGGVIVDGWLAPGLLQRFNAE